MKRVTVFIEGNKKELYLDDSIFKPDKSTMTLKNVAIYWKYRNIIAGENDQLTLGSKKITVEEGYWTFGMISEKLEGDDVKLEAIVHNNKCKIQPIGGDLDLGKLAPLLGFPESETLRNGV